MALEKSESSKTRQVVLPVHSIGVGEIHDFVSLHPILSRDEEKKAGRLLEEAQANLQFAQQSGYTPELRRNFSILALLGVGFSLTNSWYGISASMVAGISSGGPMMIVYGIVIVAFISLCIGVTLSELASAMPNAGGQYYWTSQLAPPRYAPFASYLCGALAWAGSVFTSASVCISIASSLVGMYVLSSDDPNAEAKTWQIFITYEIVNLLLVLFNLWEKPLPMISQGALYTSLISFVVITITVLARSSGNYQSAHFVFVEFSNGTGWSSSGIAFIVGLINPNWSFSCLDAAVHLAEETLSPQTDIPKAIIGTVFIGFITSFTYVISIFFCITELGDILKSNTGVPIMDIFYQALKSKAGAIVLECLIFLTAIGCNIASHTWQARLCWSFARDNGLPGSRYWSRVSRTGVPINAHLMSCAWCAVIGCIYMASTTAYNAMVTGCIIFLMNSYAIPVLFLLWKGRNNVAHGPFWLGKIGLFCNIVLLCWTVFATIFYSFPAEMPVTAGSMNYVCVVFGVYFLYCVIYWFARGKKKFRTVEDRELNIVALKAMLSNQVDDLERILSKQA